MGLESADRLADALLVRWSGAPVRRRAGICAAAALLPGEILEDHQPLLQQPEILDPRPDEGEAGHSHPAGKEKRGFPETNGLDIMITRKPDETPQAVF